ncbi:NUDIX hydrolase [Stenotrophomonas sp. MMGLT7]|uniref:NUDIX hydrolase n=1 Tax=Stenotrophomonas sp. MMGLT7 TaxID=2901227 RepID=UPI001E285DC0|nr:NUDIX hydrolase [Stenotrophomonas sp. MMGLT7]MCD7099875.1 NUDIX hydrolase [Stenotrophomonas sp. MMGLT7]
MPATPLLVRRRGPTFFMQPGGRREPGERALTTPAREPGQEPGVGLVPGGARRLGEFEHDALNEAGRSVRAEVSALRIDGIPQAKAGIAELRWVAARPHWPVAVAPLGAGRILAPLAAGA